MGDISVLAQKRTGNNVATTLHEPDHTVGAAARPLGFPHGCTH
ncbi:hypothetical protein ART_4081 [Arthrobacter sp. PAMC 25486]|nr:hypothetical protein ART_4081 [Arthrobacter sp. PAMC 25486]